MARRGNGRKVSLLLTLLFPLTVVTGALCPRFFGRCLHGGLAYCFTALLLVHSLHHKETLVRYVRDVLADD